MSLRNTGVSTQHYQVSTRSLGPDQNVQTGSVTLNDNTSPQFTNYQGLTNNYETFTFTVPAGAKRLDSSIAYPGNPSRGNNSRVRLILIDPASQFAAHSLPQGVGNFGNADVINPAAGTWTGVIFGDPLPREEPMGRFPGAWPRSNYTSFGTVTPSHVTVMPGRFKRVTLKETTPASAGDSAGSIVILPTTAGAEPTSVPVTLRSMVNVTGAGTFQGTLTGGNGRPSGEGQEEFYEFKVGANVKDITANVSLTNDTNDPVGAYLISPDGDALGNRPEFIQRQPDQLADRVRGNPCGRHWTLMSTSPSRSSATRCHSHYGRT